jgi:periplasmic divalent cation tolerance protein
MSETAVVLAVTTFSTAEQAEQAVRALVDQRLVACGTLLPGARSIYRWQGAIEAADEVVVLLKTTQAGVAALKAALPTVHPYDVPELLVLPVADGLPPYLAWVAAAVEPP